LFLAFTSKGQKEETPMMSERTIDVPGQRCTVEVYQLGKTFWVAAGEYSDKKIRARGTTERKALVAWRGVVSDKSKGSGARWLENAQGRREF
jgi:hypothetical protein